MYMVTNIIFVNRWDFVNQLISNTLDNKMGTEYYYGDILFVYIDTLCNNSKQYNTVMDILFKHIKSIKPVIMVTGNDNYLGIEMLEQLINNALQEYGIFENCIRIKEYQIRNIKN